MGRKLKWICVTAVIFGGNVKIGILGGIGPEATGRFYLELFRGLQQSGISGNRSFPQVVVNSIPAPELVGGTISDAQLLPYRTGLKQLDDSGVDFIAMVCNTIHLYRNELQREIKTPIIDLRKEVRDALAKKGIKKAAVLGTRSTIEQGLYNFPEIEIIGILPQEISELENAIVLYNRGEDRNFQRQAVRGIAEKYLAKGAEAVVLGCTELAVMLEDADIPKIDTLDILVEATIKHDRLEKNRRAEIQFLFDNACGPDD